MYAVTEGNAMDTRHALVRSALGELTLVATDGAITGLYFSHHIRMPAQDTFGPAVRVEDDALLFAAV